MIRTDGARTIAHYESRPPSIYELMNAVRAHPDYRVAVLFTADDFGVLSRVEHKSIEEQMTSAGFEAAEELERLAE